MIIKLLNINKSLSFYSILILICILLYPSNSTLVGQSNHINLNSNNQFSYNQTISITQQKLNSILTSRNASKQQKWFIFVDIEPTNQITWPDIYVDIYVRSIANKDNVHHKKVCSKQGLQLETCYISSDDFNYKEQQLLITISTDEQVSLLMQSELILMKTLELNSCLKIDSSFLIEKVSKMFKISIRQIAVSYQQIRISLTPINKIYGGQGIKMYATFGKYYPTPQHSDRHSFYAWQMGVTMIFLKQQLVETNQIYILLDYPQNYLFDLDTTLIQNYTKKIEIKTGQFYDDVITKIGSERTFIINIDHPQLNNYIRIKKYSGIVNVHSATPLQYVQGFEHKDDMNYLAQFHFEGYLDSSKFKIDKGIKKLQLKIGSYSLFQGAIYTIQTYENSKQFNWINQGQTHLAQLGQGQKIYFTSRVIRHQKQISQKSQAQIVIVNKQGSISQRIFVCKIQDVQKCVNNVKLYSQSGQNKTIDGIAQQLRNVKKLTDEIAEIKQINLQFQKQKFVNYTQQYKQQIIVIQVTGQPKHNKNVFSIQFINVGIMDSISQHQSKTQTISQGQFKIYRFTVPNDLTIQSLIFHMTFLYGFAQRVVTNIDPSGKTQQQLIQLITTQPLHFYRWYQNSIEIQKPQISKTYYLILYAKSKSLITTKVQLLKTITHPTDQSNLTYSFLYLSTASNYQFNFQPQQLVIFDLSKIGLPVLYLKSTSPLPLDLCMNFHANSKPNVLPFQPNCQARQKMGKRFQMYLNFNMMKNQFSVYNSNNKNVPLTINIQNFQKCISRQIGQKQFFEARMFQQLKITQMCLKFNLYKKGPLLVTIKPSSPVSKNAIKYQFSIGQNQIRYLVKTQTIIDAQQIELGCKGRYDNCYGSLIGKLNQENDFNSSKLLNQKFTYQVQYIDEPIDLMDGMPYSYMGQVTKQNPVHFKYGLYTIQQPVSVILQNQRGYFRILAKVIPIDQHYNYPTLQQRQNQMNPLANNTVNSTKIFQSSNQMYYLYDMLKISKQQLKQRCIHNQISYYRACTVLISVYPLKNINTYKSHSKFNLQIVQHTSLLREQQPNIGYVEIDMLNFYEIQNLVQNSTIIIHVNSNTNMQKKQVVKCLEMFAKFGINQKATSSNTHYITHKSSSQLIIQKAQKGTYSLTVKGVQSTQKYCDYTIQYSVLPPSTDGNVVVPIKTIKKSTPFNIQMSLEEDKKTQFLLFFNNALSTNFKIMTLFSKLGEVLISVMPLPTDEIQKKVLTDVKSIDSIFKAEWKDSNSLEINAQDKLYCGDCVYLIKLQCVKQMQGKLIIPEAETEISVKSNALVYDQLLKGEKSLYRIYTDSHLAFKLNVISGQLGIKIKNKKNKTLIFEKSYNSSNQEKIEVIELQRNKDYEYIRFEIVEIQCKQDSHFIFGVIKDYKNETQNKTEDVKQNNETDLVQQWIKKPKILTFGVPYTLYMSSNIKVCATGIMQQDPIFIVSLNQYVSKTFSLDNLQFQFWINNQSSNTNISIQTEKFSIEKSSKSRIIKFIKNEQKQYLTSSNNSFFICFKDPQEITIDVIQASHINYLAPNTDILIHQNMNLTFMASSDNILEINECSGHSLISISKDFGSVHSLQSEISQIRKSNSLIEFKSKGPVYINAQSTGLMFLRWKDIDYEQAKNLGYFLYEPSSFRILPSSNSDDKMTLQIMPLKDINNLKNVSKDKLPMSDNLTYEVYVESQQLDLYEAMNCHRQTGFKIQQKVDQQLNLRQSYKMDFYSLNQLKSKFSGFKYVLVSIKVVLQLKNQITGQAEDYRFFYPYQQVLFTGSSSYQQSVQVQESSQPWTISIQSLIIFFGILILVCILIICKKKELKKMIRKLLGKNRIIPQNHFELQAEITSQTDQNYYQKSNM